MNPYITAAVIAVPVIILIAGYIFKPRIPGHMRLRLTDRMTGEVRVYPIRKDRKSQWIPFVPEKAGVRVSAYPIVFRLIIQAKGKRTFRILNDAEFASMIVNGKIVHPFIQPGPNLRDQIRNSVSNYHSFTFTIPQGLPPAALGTIGMTDADIMIH